MSKMVIEVLTRVEPCPLCGDEFLTCTCQDDLLCPFCGHDVSDEDTICPCCDEPMKGEPAMVHFGLTK